MSSHYQNMIRLIQRGLYFHVGRGKLYKSYGYAGNTAWQIFKLLTASEADISRRVFYLADYEPLSLTNYADALQSELGARRIPSLPLPLARALARVGDVLNAAGLRRFPFNSFRLRNILTEYIHDLAPTRAVCGTLPYGFQEGVVATAQWFRESRRSSSAAP
jgi:GlcNAc-P-P-Und epimerase